LGIDVGRKRDIKQIDDIAKEYKIDRHEFGDFIELSKETDPGSDNKKGDYTWDELCRKAEEYLRDL
jgi:hypothetical protein